MRRRWLVFALLTTTMVSVGGVFALTREDAFPHAQHARLFPLCIGCHEGIPTGDQPTAFPPPGMCASCHTGTEQKRVDWRGPSRKASNLKFSHPAHDAKEPLECSSCHIPEGRPAMTVERTLPDQCFACHAHRATNHFVDANCSQCHVPLSRTSFTAQRVEGLPKPPSHSLPDFLAGAHGKLSRSEKPGCEVCHTRESCASCHVDAQQRAEILTIEPAGGDVKLPPMTAKYVVPASHRQPNWMAAHGARANANIADCAACHTRESCATCHAAQAPRAIAGLPSSGVVAAPGVTAIRRAPATHATPFFEQEHGVLAAASERTCMGCHKRSECEDCHTSPRGARTSMSPAAPQAFVKSSQSPDTTRPRPRRPSGKGYHPLNFMERHASPAFNRNLECSNCHDTARFCRDCHESKGMGTSGRLQAGYHDAQPTFFLNHGKPARQSMESCASCHKQTDCMQCHSALGSLRVNPHGSGFDAKRVQQRNARLCAACHLSDPLRRNP